VPADAGAAGADRSAPENGEATDTTDGGDAADSEAGDDEAGSSDDE
jgi:hypothetical protein